jgi:hypothetical protein
METPARPLAIAEGLYVEVELINQDASTDQLAFTLVPDAQADFAQGFLGVSTPLAKAILGYTVGSTVPYRAEDIRAVKILAARPSQQKPTEDVAARREAVEREAINTAEYINAMIFASAVDTKWGDYDADGLNPENWKQ